jgi:hypothetical protein
LAAALKANAANAQTSPPRAASISGIVHSFPAAVFMAVLLMRWGTCMFFSWNRMTKDRVAVGKIESWCMNFV